MVKEIALVYFVLVLAYSLMVFIKNRGDGLFRLAILIFFPVLGVFYLIFMYRPYDTLKDTIYTFNPDFISPMDPKYYVRTVDVQKETNIVPIEEALILNDNKTKRSLLIDILKNDQFTFGGFLKKALHDEDTETSHYAASAMTELLRELTLEIQRLAVEYESNKSNAEVCISYVEVLSKYIKSGMIDARTRRQYMFTYSQVLNRINYLVPENKNYFINKINCDLELKEYDSALQTCQAFMAVHSDSEDPYLMYLKTYYSLRDTIRFTEMFEKLRQSPVKLSNSSLNMVRFWLGEGSQA